MRRTERGLVLPSPPRRAWLRSFWLVLVALAGAVAGVALGVLVARGSLDGTVTLFAWSAATILLGAGGVVWPQLAAPLYQSWNRAARFYMQAARFAVKTVCFWMILTPLRWTGDRLVLSRPGAGETMWVARESLARAAYGAQHDRGPSPRGHQGWIRAYVSWAAYWHNAWAICLLPFLMVLGRLEIDDETTLPTQTYTLF